MSLIMNCPGCKTRFEFGADLAGKRIKCKSCGDVFRVTDDPPPVRSRRPADDDSGERPNSRVRRLADAERAEREAEPPRPLRSSRRDEDSDFDRRVPKRKRTNPLLIFGPIAGVLLLAVVAFLLVRGLGKKKGIDESLQGSAKARPLDLPERDIKFLIAPDTGGAFGILRDVGTNPAKKIWVYDAYDLANEQVGKRVELPGVEDPKAAVVSPDGRYLLVTESRNRHGWSGDHSLMLYSLGDGKCLTPAPAKWLPFPEDPNNVFDGPDLFKAEFVGPDRIATIGTNGAVYVYKVPTFEVEKTAQVRLTNKALSHDTRRGQDDHERHQWKVALSADHKRLAVWYGEGYVITDTVEVAEISRTPSVAPLAKEIDPGRRVRPEDIQAGPVAFSPDGKTLAGFVRFDLFSNDVVLCLWDPTRTAEPTRHHLTSTRFNDALGLAWWGSRYLVLTGCRSEGGDIEPVIIDSKTGEPVRQLMSPDDHKYAFGRDGRLWYAVSKERRELATLLVIDPPPADLLDDGGGNYEEVPNLKGAFLRRVWMEPTGVLKKPTRYNPPIQRGLVRQP